MRFGESNKLCSWLVVNGDGTAFEEVLMYVGEIVGDLEFFRFLVMFVCYIGVFGFGIKITRKVEEGKI